MTCITLIILIYYLFPSLSFIYLFTLPPPFFFFFFLNDPAPPDISPLPLHAALPICPPVPPAEHCTRRHGWCGCARNHLHNHYDNQRLTQPGSSCALTWPRRAGLGQPLIVVMVVERSEEHTSELQSHLNLVCRLLLEK